LQPVTLHDDAAADWRVALLPAYTYTAVTVAAAGVRAAAFDDAASGVHGFVVRLPAPGGTADPPTESAAVAARAGMGGASVAVRNPGRNTTSFDGFPVMLQSSLELANSELHTMRSRRRAPRR
jgi:hypothetical protein